jgi:hypothetical protein
VGHQPAAVADEHPQELELGRRQVDFRAIATDEAGGEVDLQPSTEMRVASVTVGTWEMCR